MIKYGVSGLSLKTSVLNVNGEWPSMFLVAKIFTYLLHKKRAGGVKEEERDNLCVFMFVYWYVCLCVFVYVCLCVCVYVCLCVCVYRYV